MTTVVPAQDYIYDAEVLGWVDGDTVHLEVSKSYDFGFHIKLTGTFEGHFRIQRIDTAERGHPNYKAATAEARFLAPVGTKVSIETSKYDKYGRYLAEVTLPDGRNFGGVMMDVKLAVPYGEDPDSLAIWVGPPISGLDQ